MEIRHEPHPGETALVKREFEWKADVGLDAVASVAAGFATALFTYLGLRAARALLRADEGKIEFEVEAEASRTHRPIEEPVP